MAVKTYTILVGQFRLSDGSLRGAGETVDLEDDVADQHAGRVQLVDPASAQAPAAVDPE